MLLVFFVSCLAAFAQLTYALVQQKTSDVLQRGLYVKQSQIHRFMENVNIRALFISAVSFQDVAVLTNQS